MRYWLELLNSSDFVQNFNIIQQMIDVICTDWSIYENNGITNSCDVFKLSLTLMYYELCDYSHLISKNVACVIYCAYSNQLIKHQQ